MIQTFRGEHDYLSNFYKAPVEIFGIKGETNEHIFQAMKTVIDTERYWIMDSPSPFEAKKRGRLVTMRPDWNGIRRRVMLELNLAKYNQNPKLAAALVLSAPHTLVEGNYWGDAYWGAVPAVLGHTDQLTWKDEETGQVLVGDNWLGRILMMIREVIS